MGSVDVLVNELSGGHLEIFENVGDLQFRVQVSISGQAGVRALALGDLNGDGDFDVYVGRMQGANNLYWNAGGFSFSENTLGILYSTTGTTLALVLADMDADGDLGAPFRTEAPPKTRMLMVSRLVTLGAHSLVLSSPRWPSPHGWIEALSHG